MTPQAPPGRLGVFRIPFWLALVYIAVLGVVATFPARHTSSIVGAQPSATPASAPSEYAVCGIDQTADPRTGRCVPVAATPLPCVQGSNFDAKAGFCMPVAASAPPAATAAPDPFGNFPGGIRKPTQPAAPFFGDNGNSFGSNNGSSDNSGSSGDRGSGDNSNNQP